jgi:hypothetical protein
MQSFRVIRELPKNLPVNELRIVQPAGAMMVNCDFQCLFNCHTIILSGPSELPATRGGDTISLYNF